MFKTKTFEPNLSQPIFVLGCMRSGSSYFSTVLAEHPNLVLLSDYLGPVDRIFSSVGGMPCEDVEKGCPYLDETHIDLGKIVNLGVSLTSSILNEKSAGALSRRLRFRLRTKSGGVFKKWSDQTRVLIKSTHMLNKIRYLNTIFPDAFYVLLIRDIYSHSYGIKMHFQEMLRRRGLRYYFEEMGKSCWIRKEHKIEKKGYVDPLTEFSAIPKMHIRLNNAAYEDLKFVAPERYIVIKFGDFVDNLAGEISKVWNFLGLPRRNLSLRSRRIFNSGTGNPMLAWKQGLSEREKTVIERILSTCPNYNRILTES